MNHFYSKYAILREIFGQIESTRTVLNSVQELYDDCMMNILTSLSKIVWLDKRKF